MRDKPVIATFNRGIVSRLALARAELSRVAFSAEIQTNWVPRVLGPMSLRAGFGYQGECDDDGALLPFVYASDDTAIIELTPSKMRVWDRGTSLVTRTGVTATIQNPTFNSGLAFWILDDDAGATSSYSASGDLQLLGTGYNSARVYQSIILDPGEYNDIHYIRVVVARGPVLFRVGSNTGNDDLFRQAVLRTGTHSLAVDPQGNNAISIELSSPLKYPVLVESCDFESAGVMELPTPWATADICRQVDFEQSNDVIFCASGTTRQRRIERRDNNSWSLCEYLPDDGPFLVENTESITLTPDAIDGAVTLTASRPLFREDHVGALFKLSSQGQLVAADLSSAPTWSDSIRLFGVGSSRNFNLTIAGTWSGTLTLQRSIGAEGSWVDIATFTTNITTVRSDSLDNTAVFYRIGFAAGDYTSGTAEVELEYATGSITGTVLLDAVANTVSASGYVLRSLGGTDATEFWAEGAWSDANGWPSAVSVWQGRIWWFSRGQIYGSISDAYGSFDPDFEGDAGPINKGFGVRAAQNPRWAIGLKKLLVGTDEAEYDIRSNALNEPVTPTNFNVSPESVEGSSDVLAVPTKDKIAFVDRSGQSVYEAKYSQTFEGVDTKHSNVLVPELLSEGVIRLGAQRKPDERIHAVRGDGKVAVLVRDDVEEVTAWYLVETDGIIEDVVCLPNKGQLEDDVFYRVKRTINGNTVRYLEKMARQIDCVGGQLSLLADSYVTGTGSVDGLNHLEGETVVIWGDGDDQGTGVVSGGAVSGHSYTTWCAGLPYTAQFKSAKLAMQPGVGVMLNETTRIDRIAFTLADSHSQGLQFGPDFDNLDDMPLVEEGAVIGSIVHVDYAGEFIEFPGDFSSDARICLQAAAPRPCTVMSASMWLDRNPANG